jgi:phage terminase large subunit-like protein
LGPAADRVGAALFGRPMQTWQSAVNRVAGELTEGGEMLHPIVVLHVPRRAGKTAIALTQLVRRCLGQPRSQSWYTAQTGGDAGRTFRREWLPILRSCGLAGSNGRLKVSLRAGSESFELRPLNTTVTCFPPIEAALHGTNVDLAVIDEAWSHDLAAGAGVEMAVFPAQLTRPQSQTWIVSAGGTIASTWWDGWLERGEQALAAGDPSIAIFDWGADPDDPAYDPASPATWWTAHPALGDTITESAIAAELARSSSIAAFERSVLNVWPRPRALKTGIDLSAWADLADLDVRASPAVLAFDVAADRSSASMATAGVARDGRVIVEVVDDRAGTGWIEREARAWRQANRAGLIVADALNAGTIAARLELAGLDVLQTSAGQMAKACADLIDQITNRTIGHRSQAILDNALHGAGRRPLGDGWAWSRRNSEGSIAPLVAVTLAAWAARSTPRLPAPFVIVAPGR